MKLDAEIVMKEDNMTTEHKPHSELVAQAKEAALVLNIMQEGQSISDPLLPECQQIIDALESLEEQLEAVTKQRDACMRMAAAERPPDAVFNKALQDEYARLKEQVEALREECADWERGADEELARAWKERALASEEQYEARTRDFMAAVERNEEKDRGITELQEQLEAAERERDGLKEQLETFRLALERIEDANRTPVPGSRGLGTIRQIARDALYPASEPVPDCEHVWRAPMGTAHYSCDKCGVSASAVFPASESAPGRASGSADLGAHTEYRPGAESPASSPATKPYVRPADDPHTLVAKALAPDPASKPYCTCPEGADGNPCAVCGKPESVTYPASETRTTYCRVHGYSGCSCDKVAFPARQSS